MPKTKRAKPLYSRGKYRLDRRKGRENLVITWYDVGTRRERGISAGSADVGEAKEALDRLYLETDRGICPACGKPRAAAESILVTTAIADYLVLAQAKPSYDAIGARLSHIVGFIGASKTPTLRCVDIDEGWIARFRSWAIKQPIVSPTGKTRARSLSTVENSVIQLAAAIAQTGQRPNFKPIQTKELNRSPQYRADIETLAAMFRYALEPDRQRDNLHAFLLISVATWARPDAAYDVSTLPERRQWFPEARTLALNPHGRRQTRKYRATVPVARQLIPHLEHCDGFFVPVQSIKSAWEKMASALDLPGNGESGTKLIRRSVSHLARGRIGEEHWTQGRIMLGHHKASTSDIYALPDPAHLGRALAATEAIIDEIEALAPGAVYRAVTARDGNVTAIRGGKNG